jgi:hypothetical protein
MLKRKYLFILLGACLMISSCNPKVTKSIIRTYPPLNSSTEISVLDLRTPIPIGAENLGSIKIGDSGFSTNCTWNTVIEKAKSEARRVGGNVIKITEHKQPDIVSSCHRIKVTILKVKNIDEISFAQDEDKDLTTERDYALIHFYTFTNAFNCDFYLNNEILFRGEKFNWKKTVQTRTFGFCTIKANTSRKAELPLTIKKGGEYYIFCDVEAGGWGNSGIPTLHLVPRDVWEEGTSTIKTK